MNQVRLDKFNNKNYSAGNLVYRVIWYMISLAFFETAFPFPIAVKRSILRMFGAEIGKGVIIKPRVHSAPSIGHGADAESSPCWHRTWPQSM